MLKLRGEIELGFPLRAVVPHPTRPVFAALPEARRERGRLIEAAPDGALREIKSSTFYAAFVAADGRMRLVERTKSGLVVTPVDAPSEARVLSCVEPRADDGIEEIDGPLADRITLADSRGTTIVDAAADRVIARVPFPIVDWRVHPSRKLAAYRVQDEGGELGCCWIADGKLAWREPSLQQMEAIVDFAFSPDGGALAIVSAFEERRTTALYDFPRLRLRYYSDYVIRRRGANGRPTFFGAVAFHPRRSTFFTAGEGGLVVERRRFDGDCVDAVEAHPDEVARIVAWPALGSLLTLDVNGRGRLWRLAHDAPVDAPRVHEATTREFLDLTSPASAEETPRRGDVHCLDPLTELPPPRPRGAAKKKRPRS